MRRPNAEHKLEEDQDRENELVGGRIGGSGGETEVKLNKTNSLTACKLRRVRVWRLPVSRGVQTPARLKMKRKYGPRPV